MSTTTHTLKTWPRFYEAVFMGVKTFEVRRNDRGFQRGDKLRLVKWDPATELYVNKYGEPTPDFYDATQITVRVAYVLNGFGIEPGFVVMGIELVDGEAAS